ncbi:hypothetical protein ACHAWF_010727, partial [Thalassiosira exigua]
MKVVKSTSTALAFFQLCLLTSARARSRVSRGTRKDTSVIEGRGTAKESRIIGGFEATEDQYSFAVSLQDDFGPFCGASLIAKDVVLTAAHCAGAPYNALVGRHDMTDKDGQEIPMKLEYPHPNYNDESDKNDIMIVFLNGPVTIDVDLIKPNSNPAVPAVGEEVTVVGWGDMDARESHETVPDSLHEVEVKVISNEECRSSSGTFEGGEEVYGDDITASNLCARADDKDSCQGDSGGPLFHTQGSEYVQVGVVSWGIGCAHDDFPGVYARVSSFYNWIQEGWYFTSKNGGPDKNKTTILRKRRANLTLANIEEVFLGKAASRGEVGDDDVVAYFISSGADTGSGKKALDASFDDCSAVVGDDVSCDIEYFNKTTLREFLQHGRNNKSGILQRFVKPHGGGRHNSQIRAIWTPKLCILERRRTKQDLHDARFALYERAVTFDGPDVHSVSVPLRGTVLSGRVESICNEIVQHIADVAADSSGSSKGSTLGDKKSADDHAFHGVARMVVNFKVDGNGKIWILWSNSIRLNSEPVDRTNLTEPDATYSMEAPSSRPLNMETVVRLPPSVKLTQDPNHKANAILDNEMSFATCPSCNRHDSNAHFQPVPYKTIIQHFEKMLGMLKERDDSHPTKVWPPEERFIKAAGSVGFGSLPSQLERDRATSRRKKYSEETHMIPPVIRAVNPKLRVKGYAMYRDDPIFLLKKCDVCEDCFLAYAELTSTSFTHMTRPIEPYETEGDDVRYEFPKGSVASKRSGRGQSVEKDAPSSNEASVFGLDFGPAPELPPAITEPPK